MYTVYVMNNVNSKNSKKSIITDPLPYNCENEQALSQKQIEEGEYKNIKIVDDFAKLFEQMVEDSEFLPRKTFLDAGIKKIITVLVHNAYDSIQRAGRYASPEIEVSASFLKDKFMLTVSDNGTGFVNNTSSSNCIPFGGNHSGTSHVQNDLLNKVNGTMRHWDNKIGATVCIEIPLTI